MTNAVTFKVLEDIARDLSGSEITFPTFLDITFQVRSALKDPNLSIDQLAKLVGAEPLMSAKIIRMANSVALNPSGREIAENMYQRHRVLAQFLMRLGVQEATAFADACRMEHDISAETFSAICRHAEKGWE
jgi:HD-like signal output (HDOD) protein